MTLRTVSVNLHELTEKDIGRFLIVPDLPDVISREFYHPSSEDGAFRSIRFLPGTILLISSVIKVTNPSDPATRISIFYVDQTYYRYERGIHHTPYLIVTDEFDEEKKSNRL